MFNILIGRHSLQEYGICATIQKYSLTVQEVTTLCEIF